MRVNSKGPIGGSRRLWRGISLRFVALYIIYYLVILYTIHYNLLILIGIGGEKTSSKGEKGVLK